MKTMKTKKLTQKEVGQAVLEWAKKEYKKADKRTIKVEFCGGLFGLLIKVKYNEK